MIGVGGPDATPVGLDLRAAAALVAGVAGSGRSTVLDVAAAVVRRRGGRVVVVRPRPLTRPGPHVGLVGTDVELDGTDPGALRDAVDPAHGATLVVVDDVALLQDRPAEDVLLAVADTWDRTGSGLLVAGATASLAGRYRGAGGPGAPLRLRRAARRRRARGRGPALRHAPPGRARAGRAGYLVRHGAVDRVQVADTVAATAPLAAG